MLIKLGAAEGSLFAYAGSRERRGLFPNTVGGVKFGGMVGRDGCELQHAEHGFVSPPLVQLLQPTKKERLVPLCIADSHSPNLFQAPGGLLA